MTDQSTPVAVLEYATVTGVCFSSKGRITSMGQATALKSEADLFQIDSEGMVFIDCGLSSPVHLGFGHLTIDPYRTIKPTRKN